jgi:hypothetical protein
MIVELHLTDGGSVVVPPSDVGFDRVLVYTDCPSCKSSSPIEVRGRGITRHDHDTCYAVAEHIKCGASIGELRVKVSTIFGIEEDRRVLNERCRVY